MNREDPKRVHVLSAQQREMLVEFVWNCESSLDGAIGAYNLNADLDQELFEQTTDVNPQGYGNAQGDDEELVVEVDQTEGNRQDEQARPAVRLSGKLLPTPLHAPLSPTETSKGGAKLSSDVYVIEGHLESGVAIPLDGEFNPKPKRGVPMMLFTPGIRDDNNYGSMTSKAGMMLFTPSKSNRTSSFNSLTAKTSSVGKPKHGADNGNESLSSTQNQHDGSLRDPRGALWSLEQPNASFRVGIDLFGVAHSLRESFASLGHGARWNFRQQNHSEQEHHLTVLLLP
ncbi:unnamed protein product [Amoebophrya sp. A25]|nr:unnamed protein product [Amoebophrya sp. A25]|eukprot:GSA25T00002265001.1